jgi:hypothetical protein
MSQYFFWNTTVLKSFVFVSGLCFQYHLCCLPTSREICAVLLHPVGLSYIGLQKWATSHSKRVHKWYNDETKTYLSLYLVVNLFPNCTHEAEWTPFQTHSFPDNLVAPEIEPGPLDLQPTTLTTRPQRWSLQNITNDLLRHTRVNGVTFKYTVNSHLH